MSKFISLFLCLLTTSVMASNQDTTSNLLDRQPLLVKESGLIDANWNNQKQYECSIYYNRIVIKTFAGGVELVREVPISFEGGIIGLIRLASVGEMHQEETHGSFAYAAYLTYYAYNIPLEDSLSASSFVLYTTKDRLQINMSEQATALRQFLDMNCR